MTSTELTDEEKDRQIVEADTLEEVQDLLPPMLKPQEP